VATTTRKPLCRFELVGFVSFICNSSERIGGRVKVRPGSCKLSPSSARISPQRPASAREGPAIRVRAAWGFIRWFVGSIRWIFVECCENRCDFVGLFITMSTWNRAHIESFAGNLRWNTTAVEWGCHYRPEIANFHYDWTCLDWPANLSRSLKKTKTLCTSLILVCCLAFAIIYGFVDLLEILTALWHSELLFYWGLSDR